MYSLTYADLESNGLLMPQAGKTLGTKVHCLGANVDGTWWVGIDDETVIPRDIRENIDKAGKSGVLMPNGEILKDVHFCTIQELIRKIEDSELVVGHNWQDFDERFLHKCYPWFKPKGKALDTLILWKLLYPQIYRDGPNTHKCPGQLKMRYSLEAIGYRLGEKKNKEFDPGDWQTLTWDMVTYMIQDVVVLVRAFQWAMKQQPDPRAVDIEHGFAAIMRRQEAWGFTFDYEAALSLQALVQKRIQELEVELVDRYGEWWVPSAPVYPKATRNVKLPTFPDVTERRFGVGGKELKPYVGPPKCEFVKDCPYTPIERVQFNPGSREHVRLMLQKNHGWTPSKFTDKGTPQIDDDVLRALPYEEAPKLADYYAAKKVSGYVSEGKQAWLLAAREEPDAYRMHGRVNTIGTYSYRASHSTPNMGQIPTRDPTYGPLCRQLFRSRDGFVLVGFDGSGVQLRGLAHYLARGGRWPSGERWGDGGVYAGVFERDEDPHAFMRDSIGYDLMGEDEEGRRNGKTMNYALCFGGGDERLGSICRPHATQAMKRSIGQEVKKRMLPVFGTAFVDLKVALGDRVQETRTIVGLDGTIARVSKPHAALATLLQLFEAKVMKKALILHDGELQRRGLRPGVNKAGMPDPVNADYEYCANVHDEAQADVRRTVLPIYEEVSRWAVPEAGIQLRVRCPLKADVKTGQTWNETH